MDFTLVKIRLLRAKREIRSLGLLYSLLFAALISGAVFVLYKQYLQRPNCWAAAGILLALAVVVQVSRTDKEFVFRQLPNPKRAVFTEYSLLSLPFTVPVLFTPHWYCFLVLTAGFLALAGWRYSVSSRYTLFPWLSRFTGKQNFEWTSGARKSLPALVLVYCLALAFCWVPVLPLFFLWGISLIAISFYQESEPLPLLRAFAIQPDKILKQKIVRHGKLLLLLQLPVLLLALLFNPQLWYVYVLFPPLQLLLLASAILLKYSSYEPNRKVSANMLLTSLAAFGTLVPALLPLPLFICFRYWGKAKERLQFYLHD